MDIEHQFDAYIHSEIMYYTIVRSATTDHRFYLLFTHISLFLGNVVATLLILSPQYKGIYPENKTFILLLL